MEAEDPENFEENCLRFLLIGYDRGVLSFNTINVVLPKFKGRKKKVGISFKLQDNIFSLKIFKLYHLMKVDIST